MGYFRSSQLLVFINPKSSLSSLSSRRRTNASSFRENLKESLLDDDKGRGAEAAIPKGFLAVYVGPELTRFVIPTSYLCLPIFKALMDKMAEEFGFEQTGGLRIPCDEDYFRQILRVLNESEAERKAMKNNKKKNTQYSSVKKNS
ncbi:auxin-responsive protein SAUR21-like [Ananas comosus]|uniref:Auxin-induced protein 15A n=1 Tax=Ananas comosus TaxID=4615 RepID=A0A199V0E6_ANACO|nr:auxin-responsive protein SAUR21-like [Ananas comosus]OAY70356.1 Auxin-induced protein 15A [Ananas comosus]